MYSFKKVHWIVSKYYCTRLTISGACPAELQVENACAACVLNVRNRMDAADWTDVRYPYRLFTWMMKDLSGRVIEAAVATQKAAPTNNRFGERDETNAVDAFEEMLNG